MGTVSRYRIIIISSVLVILTGFVFLWIRFRTAEDPEVVVRSVPVSAVRPEIRNLQNSITLQAVLESERTIAVIPRVPGTILAILADEGTEVKEGEIIAEIDSEPYRLELESAEAVWLLADSSFTRLNRINESSGVSRQQLEEAKAERDAARAAYELAEMRLKYAQIEAPVSGLVLKRFSDSGDSAFPGEPLFLIGDNGDPRMKVQVPEKYWSYFTELGSIRALVSYPSGGDEEIRESKILRVGPSVSPESKTFEVLCVIPAEENPWPPGGDMRVEFILEERRDTWSLPLSALSGDSEVWRVDTGSSRVSRLILPEIFRDHQYFAVPEGWSDGLFVLHGQHLLRDGHLVEVYEADT